MLYTRHPRQDRHHKTSASNVHIKTGLRLGEYMLRKPACSLTMVSCHLQCLICSTQLAMDVLTYRSKVTRVVLWLTPCLVLTTAQLLLIYTHVYTDQCPAAIFAPAASFAPVASTNRSPASFRLSLDPLPNGANVSVGMRADIFSTRCPCPRLHYRGHLRGSHPRLADPASRPRRTDGEPVERVAW